MAKEIVELTDANFETEVLRSGVPVMVDFWAVWCGPCRAVAPVVEALAKEYEGRFKVGKMNVDDHPDTPGRYGIMSIPTLLFFKGGRQVGQVVGAVPRAKIETEMKRHM